MATKINHGKDSTFTWTSGSVVVSEAMVTWVIEVTGDNIDISSSDETTYTARLGLFKTWTLTVDVLDSDTAYTEANIFGALGEKADATLVTKYTPSTAETNTYTGLSAMLIGYNKTLAATELVTHTFSFQGSGAITLATS